MEQAEEFVVSGVEYLRKTFPERTENTDFETLKNRFIDACLFAASCGFETRRDVMNVVDLLWRLPDGTDMARLKEVADDAGREPELKIEALENAAALILASSGNGEVIGRL